MNAPIFLSVAQVQQLHQIALERFGGMEGVREQGLLESAVMQPQHISYYTQGDLFEIASAYAYHLAENQPFLSRRPTTRRHKPMLMLRISTNPHGQAFNPRGVFSRRHKDTELVTPTYDHRFRLSAPRREKRISSYEVC